MIPLPHPIPYQGSKRALAPLIGRVLPREIATFYEPFAGSAAMTIFVAHHRLAERFVLADSLAPMVALHRSLVTRPDQTAERYRLLWEGQHPDDADYFNRIRDRFNRAGDPVDLLYLICRCVKNAVRFSRGGRFCQSVDRRRLGVRPDRMRKAILAVSGLLAGRTEFRTGDWRETTADAGPADFLYLDPPYLGTTRGPDRRYHQQLTPDALCTGLAALTGRGLRFALSYDGTTGARSYGPPLPDSLGLTRLLLPAGPSAQATLSGRREETVESLYVTQGLVPATATPDR